MKEIEVTSLPKNALEKAQVIGNVFHQLDKGTSKLKAIDGIVSTDWACSVTDDMVDLHTGKYKEFTQKQAEEMAGALSQIYMIAHTIHCRACDESWDRKHPIGDMKG